MAVLYPMGYQTQLVSLDKLREVHAPKMHPEFERRVFPWIESMEGLIGIGDGWRPNPDPVSPASSQGKSFHQDQKWASGFKGYAALDLVARRPGGKHRSPTWDETASAPIFGCHAFIGKDTATHVDDEQWHLQPLEIRGWQTWESRGRPDPIEFPLPTDPPPGRLIFMERFALAGPDGNGYRLEDTRDNGGPKVRNTHQFGITDPDAAGAVAVTVNMTVTQPDAPGNLAVWGTGVNPGTSKVNWVAPDVTIANEVTVRLSGFGTFQAFPSCPLHVVVDVVGYWFG